MFINCSSNSRVSEAEEPTEDKWCNVYEVAARPLKQEMLNSDVSSLQFKNMYGGRRERESEWERWRGGK